jgi:hypothetical protein
MSEIGEDRNGEDKRIIALFANFLIYAAAATVDGTVLGCHDGL